MSRPTWDETFMGICKVVAKRSTCAKFKTAAIVVKDLNVLSIGYNGVPSGVMHCEDYWGELKGSDRMAHRVWSSRCELHAEINSLVNCSGNLKDATLYTLYSPCIDCAKAIASAKISRVVYVEEYARGIADTRQLFEIVGIDFMQLTDN